MELAADLSAEALAAALPGREIRSYPAVLSTDADARAWARAGAGEGAIVVADYQASPRGRAGLEWHVDAGVGLCFSLILRPQLPPEREGWLYTAVTCGLADALDNDATIRWPDEVRKNDVRAGAVGVHVELGPERSEWAVVNVLVPEVRERRVHVLARVVEAVEARYRGSADSVLADYLSRCETIGRRVRALLIPMGPSGPKVEGTAVGSLMDGALLLETDEGPRIAVRPQSLGLLEMLDG